MLKKTITYKDLDNNDVTEDFYFNLSPAEVTEMELSYKGGLSVYLRQIIEAEDGGAIIAAMKNIIVSSVGRRSEDGKRFVKSPEIAADFLHTDAYSVLFMELVTDAGAATEFIQGIVPANVADKMKEGPITDLQLPDEPAWIRENREPTTAELQNMTPEQIREAFKRKNTPSE